MNISYQCAPVTQWVVETDSIVLVNRETGTTCPLEYPQAAIWDFLTRGYLYKQVIPMLSAITKLDENTIQVILAESLEEWELHGFLFGIE